MGNIKSQLTDRGISELRAVDRLLPFPEVATPTYFHIIISGKAVRWFSPLPETMLGLYCSLEKTQALTESHFEIVSPNITRVSTTPVWMGKQGEQHIKETEGGECSFGATKQTTMDIFIMSISGIWRKILELTSYVDLWKWKSLSNRFFVIKIYHISSWKWTKYYRHKRSYLGVSPRLKILEKLLLVAAHSVLPCAEMYHTKC